MFWATPQRGFMIVFEGYISTKIFNKAFWSDVSRHSQPTTVILSDSFPLRCLHWLLLTLTCCRVPAEVFFCFAWLHCHCSLYIRHYVYIFRAIKVAHSWWTVQTFLCTEAHSLWTILAVHLTFSAKVANYEQVDNVHSAQ